MRGRRAARAATILPGAVSWPWARNAWPRAVRIFAGFPGVLQGSGRAVRLSPRDDLEQRHAALLLAHRHAFAVGRPAHGADLAIRHLHIDGLARTARAPQHQAPIAATAQQVLASGLPGE